MDCVPLALVPDVGARVSRPCFSDARRLQTRRRCLTYNDYGIEYDNEEQGKKQAAVLALLRRMKGG